MTSKKDTSPRCQKGEHERCDRFVPSGYPWYGLKPCLCSCHIRDGKGHVWQAGQRPVLD
jgi:hypothetical protein